MKKFKRKVSAESNLLYCLFVNAGDVVLPHLLEWVRFHVTKGELGATRILKDKLLPGAEAKHADYWPVVITLILQVTLLALSLLLSLRGTFFDKVRLQVQLICAEHLYLLANPRGHYRRFVLFTLVCALLKKSVK